MIRDVVRKERPRNRGWFWLKITGLLLLFFGVFFWFTSARILQQPIHVDYGPADAAFASALGPIVGAEFTAGNAVTMLVNGDAFLPAMLKAIRQAKKTVTLETYIWASGRVSDDFIAALGERAGDGVKVHVLLDGMGTLKFKREDRARLEKAGVQVMKYGREHWYQIKPNINHRTHRKLLIIDGRIGFTGGMCIDDSWLGDGKSENNWRETQIRVEGPVVRQMQAVFATNWMQTTGTLLLGEDYYPVPERMSTSLAQCFMSGPTERPEAVRLAHIFAIAAARKTIDIANAYFVPDDLAIEMLLDARQRGVRVRVIVPAINDSIDWACRLSFALGQTPRGRRGIPPIPAGDVSRQIDGRRWRARDGRLREFRQSLLRHQRRGHPHHTRPRGGRREPAHFRGRFERCRSRWPRRSSRRGRSISGRSTTSVACCGRSFDEIPDVAEHGGN